MDWKKLLLAVAVAAAILGMATAYVGWNITTTTAFILAVGLLLTSGMTAIIVCVLVAVIAFFMAWFGFTRQEGVLDEELQPSVRNRAPSSATTPQSNRELRSTRTSFSRSPLRISHQELSEQRRQRDLRKFSNSRTSNQEILVEARRSSGRSGVNDRTRVKRGRRLNEQERNSVQSAGNSRRKSSELRDPAAKDTEEKLMNKLRRISEISTSS